jgi:alpha-N-acetylglucosamine transferase
MGVKHQSYDFSSLAKSNAELAMDYTQVKLPMGKYDYMDSFFVPTLTMEKTAFRFENVAQDNQEAYTVKTQLMFVTPSEDNWTRIIQVTPSLHTDLDAIDEDAFSLMGLAIWRYQSSEVSAWTMGVGFNRLFGEYKPIPLLSYQYQVATGFLLDLGFPITKAECRWQNNWSTYTSIAPVGGNWRYEGTDHEKLNISYTSWVAAAGLRYQLKPRVWASLEFGQSLARKLNLDADNSVNEDVDVADTPVIMLSFGFHP